METIKNSIMSYVASFITPYVNADLAWFIGVTILAVVFLTFFRYIAKYSDFVRDLLVRFVPKYGVPYAQVVDLATAAYGDGILTVEEAKAMKELMVKTYCELTGKDAPNTVTKAIIDYIAEKLFVIIAEYQDKQPRSIDDIIDALQDADWKQYTWIAKTLYYVIAAIVKFVIPIALPQVTVGLSRSAVYCQAHKSMRQGA